MSLVDIHKRLTEITFGLCKVVSHFDPDYGTEELVLVVQVPKGEDLDAFMKAIDAEIDAKLDQSDLDYIPATIYEPAS